MTTKKETPLSRADVEACDISYWEMFPRDAIGLAELRGYTQKRPVQLAHLLLPKMRLNIFETFEVDLIVAGKPFVRGPSWLFGPDSLHNPYCGRIIHPNDVIFLSIGNASPERVEAVTDAARFLVRYERHDER